MNVLWDSAIRLIIYLQLKKGLVANGQRGPLWWPLRVSCGSSTNQVYGLWELVAPRPGRPPPHTLCQIPQTCHFVCLVRGAWRKIFLG